MPKPVSIDEIVMDTYKTYNPEDLEEYKPTNADRIRNMTDSELAEVIMCPHGQDRDYCAEKKDCLQCCLEWLQSEVEE